MAEDKKICPILSYQSRAKEFIDCQREKCQWWIVNNCSITFLWDMAVATNDIRDKQ